MGQNNTLNQEPRVTGPSISELVKKNGREGEVSATTLRIENRKVMGDEGIFGFSEARGDRNDRDRHESEPFFMVQVNTGKKSLRRRDTGRAKSKGARTWKKENDLVGPAAFQRHEIVEGNKKKTELKQGRS